MDSNPPFTFQLSESEAGIVGEGLQRMLNQQGHMIALSSKTCTGFKGLTGDQFEEVEAAQLRITALLVLLRMLRRDRVGFIDRVRRSFPDQLRTIIKGLTEIAGIGDLLATSRSDLKALIARGHKANRLSDRIQAHLEEAAAYHQEMEVDQASVGAAT
jgi:hypothetical protein